MATHGPEQSPDLLLRQIQAQLAEYESRRDVGSLRELTVMIVGIERTVRQLGRSVAVAAGLSPTSALGRIRGYFQEFPNEIVAGIELAVVSGIAQYARRIRELRDEGFVIRTGPDAVDPKTGIELRADQYLYVPADQVSGPIRQ